MKTWKILLICFAALFAIVIGSSIWNGNRRQPPAQVPETVTVTTQRTPKPAKKEDLDAVYHVCDLLRQKMPESEVHMEYDPEDQIVFYRISRPDLSAEIIELTKVTPTMKDDWDSMADSMIFMQKQMDKYFEKAGVEDMTVVVQIVNPKDQSEVWLAVANGIAGYDVVNGIDLLNGQG